jgi:hypothetical protein
MCHVSVRCEFIDNVYQQKKGKTCYRGKSNLLTRTATSRSPDSCQIRTNRSEIGQEIFLPNFENAHSPQCKVAAEAPTHRQHVNTHKQHTPSSPPTNPSLPTIACARQNAKTSITHSSLFTSFLSTPISQIPFPAMFIAFLLCR